MIRYYKFFIMFWRFLNSKSEFIRDSYFSILKTIQYYKSVFININLFYLNLNKMHEKVNSHFTQWCNKITHIFTREFTSIKRLLGFRRSIFMGGFFGLRFSLILRLFISSSNQLLSLGFFNSFFVERRNQFVFGV